MQVESGHRLFFSAKKKKRQVVSGHRLFFLPKDRNTALPIFNNREVFAL